MENPDTSKKGAAAQHLERAYQLENQGEIQAALESCKLAQIMDPTSAEAYNLSGILYDEMGKLDEAIKAYRHALELDPDFEDARANLEDAERESRGLNAVHIDPSIPPIPADVSEEAQETLADAYAVEADKEFEEALKICEKALELAPRWAEAHNLRGILLEALEEPEKALEAYHRAIELDPGWTEARENLKLAQDEVRATPYLQEAYKYEEEGNLEDALSACHAAEDIAPHWAEIFNLKGIILDELERPDDAIKAYRQAVSLDPDFEDARENLEEAEKESGFPSTTSDRPVDWVVPTYVPEVARQLLEETYTLENNGDYPAALKKCKEALLEAPDWAEAHNLRGIILEELERTEEAIASYERALELNPNFEDARANLEDARRDRSQETDDPLVTIARYYYPLHARLAKGRLEAVGIYALVLDEQTASLIYGGAVGGIRLQVRESDVERALEILDEEPESPNDAENAEETEPTENQ